MSTDERAAGINTDASRFESPRAGRAARRSRRFGGRAAAAQPVSVAEPQARTASEESLGRVRARQKMFFVQCFQGSGEDPGWTIPEDPG